MVSGKMFPSDQIDKLVDEVAGRINKAENLHKDFDFLNDRLLDQKVKVSGVEA